jgi:hypothetical protein
MFILARHMRQIQRSRKISGEKKAQSHQAHSGSSRLSAHVDIICRVKWLDDGALLITQYDWADSFSLTSLRSS